jgi:hypothetical protein
MQNGTPGAPALFGPGDSVVVVARADGEVWLAVRVQMVRDINL